jgi:hypothetical protein
MVFSSVEKTSTVLFLYYSFLAPKAPLTIFSSVIASLPPKKVGTSFAGRIVDQINSGMHS